MTGDLGFAPFTVDGVTDVADRIRTIRFAPTECEAVSPWEVGAHIDVRLPSGLVRQYSLCGASDDLGAYTVGVLHEVAGRGGSAEMHSLAAGDRVEIHGPRNNFPLQPASGYTFVAGGIGITPIISMVRQADKAGLPWRLVYAARSDSAMAFKSELQERFAHRVTFMPEDTHGRINLAELFTKIDSGESIYACGPPPMLAAMEDAAAAMGCEGNLYLERFGKSETDRSTPRRDGGTFQVRLARSGEVVDVQPEQSIIDAVLPKRPDLPYSCLEGYCGTCEAKVTEGIPDHHDDFLSPTARATNRTMMICVGRAKSALLELDL
jgi:ferredoxin-NADP reductase